MRRYSGPEMTMVAKALIDATREGPPSQWNDRMAEIVREAGFPLEEINWIGAPITVAHDIASQMNSDIKLHVLDQILTARKEGRTP